MSKKKSGRRVWRGVTTATASLLALSVCASTVVDGFRTDIDKFLGTKSTKLVTEDSDGTDLYTFKSDYTSTTELLHGIQDVGERMSEEGSVLLKNNGALPLTQDETQKITLLGFSSYYPVQGGDMGSGYIANTGTDADTVDMVGAFKAKGFGLNQTVSDMYEALKPTYKSEVQSWGGTVEYNHITAPSTTGVFSSKEPSQAALDGQNATWKDSMNDNNVMIVTIARSASENGSYNPGTAGVDPTQNLNQTDPLGLSDDERDLINAAVTAKAANGGKVIVLLNNASAMEVQEIEDNVGVDAILQVGLPGGYGFYGVADILSGAVSPSGHLTDTYAVKNASAPSAQNFGDLQWANANPDISMNDAIVEAENIYIGYKYYETRYFDTVMGQGNAASTVGSSTGSAWNYDDEVTYPFGYGLSYTTFEQTLDNLNVDLENETVTANVTVKNTGSVAGKDVVQLYVSLPYTDYDKEHGVEKAAIQLLDYGKTAELAPGASETVTITADMQNMASWDSTADNAVGTKGCYILDAGDYWFTIGNGAHEAVNNVLAAEGQSVDGSADKAKSWTLDSFDSTTFATTKNGTAVENQLADMDINSWLPGTATYLTRADWEGTFPKTYKNLTASDEMLDILDNDIYEINRTGVSVFMTEQQARENELRGTQASIEDAGALGIMTAFNRVGITAANAHTGLLKNILRGEWGFKGLESQDFIMNPNYAVLKEYALNGGTMTTFTGENTMAAVSEKFAYWITENVGQDTELMSAIKQAMTWQAYALANSNAMDGMASSTRLVSVRTWYDNALVAVQVVFAALTVLAAAMYVLNDRKSKKQ